MCKFALLLSLSLAASAMARNVMLMNRIGPSKSELYVANADGTGEHKLLNSAGFDYYASYSYDGKWIVFTSERNGYGQADVMDADGQNKRVVYSPTGQTTFHTGRRTAAGFCLLAVRTGTSTSTRSSLTALTCAG